MIFQNAGSNGFTGPEERNGRSEGSTAGDPSMRITGSAPLDVLSRAQAGIRTGVIKRHDIRISMDGKQGTVGR